MKEIWERKKTTLTTKIAEDFNVKTVLNHSDYLDKINNGYLDYFKSQTNLNGLIIDVSDRDFVEIQKDYI